MQIQTNVSEPACRLIPSIVRFISDCLTLTDAKSLNRTSVQPNVGAPQHYDRS